MEFPREIIVPIRFVPGGKGVIFLADQNGVFINVRFGFQLVISGFFRVLPVFSSSATPGLMFFVFCLFQFFLIERFVVQFDWLEGVRHFGVLLLDYYLLPQALSFFFLWKR